MAEIFKETGDEKFRDAFLRAVEWYRKAMRYDGGMFRGTYRDFNTDSWGHATSGTACAVIMFIEAMKITGSDELLPYVEKGLDFCCKMQFTNPQDAYLKGAILEKMLPISDGWGRDGTDASPYYIRDLGTIFFIQAAAKYLNA